MDDHLVIVTVEYHAMADTPGDAIRRVLDNLYDMGHDLLPHSIEVKVTSK